MSAPNLLNISSVVAHTAAVTLSSTTANVIVNASGSNTVAKVESLMIFNNSGSAVSANVILNRSVIGGTVVLFGNISIPAYSTLAAMGRDVAIYLEEGDQLQANSSVSTTNIYAGYEILAT